MKKIISILIVFVVLSTLCFVACGEKEEDLGDKNNEAICDYKMTKAGDEFTLTADSKKDFVILNFTDTQLDYDSWVTEDNVYDIAKEIMTF